MSEFKYVIVRQGMFGYPFIFPDKLVHVDVARHMIRLLNEEEILKRKKGEPKQPAVVVSGGHIYTLNPEGFRHGSESLALIESVEQKKADAELIRNFNYGHGIMGD